MVVGSNVDVPQVTLTLEALDNKVNELTETMNLRTGQLQTKFQEVDMALARHEQMLSVVESVCGARLSSMEDAMKQTETETVRLGSMTEFMNAKMIAVDAAIDDMNAAQQQMFGNLSSQTTQCLRQTELVVNEIHSINAKLMEADRCCHNLNDRLTASEKNRSTAGRGGLIDPKLIAVPIFGGDKSSGNQKEFIDWRDIVEQLTDQYYSGLKPILEKVRRMKDRFTERDFDDAKNMVESSYRI